jgi:tagatose 1,6-diphosphate aldolase
LILDAFQFLDPGTLRDDDLQLVAPEARWINDFLAACNHPLTRRDAYPLSCVSRHHLQQFLNLAPFGREPGDPASGRVPTYHYWMVWRPTPGVAPPPLRIAGAISLRIGSTRSLEMYYGHVGYHVYPAARGRRFAERACRTLLPLARAHGMTTLWITCNPDNHASRKTCERLGATLVEIVPVPLSDPLYARGDHEKCRYRLDLGNLP